MTKEEPIESLVNEFELNHRVTQLEELYRMQ